MRPTTLPFSRRLGLNGVDWDSPARYFDFTLACLRCGAPCDGHYIASIILNPSTVAWGHVYAPCGCVGVGQTRYRATPEVMAALALARDDV